MNCLQSRIVSTSLIFDNASISSGESPPTQPQRYTAPTKCGWGFPLRGVRTRDLLRGPLR